MGKWKKIGNVRCTVFPLESEKLSNPHGGGSKYSEGEVEEREREREREREEVRKKRNYLLVDETYRLNLLTLV